MPPSGGVNPWLHCLGHMSAERPDHRQCQPPPSQLEPFLPQWSWCLTVRGAPNAHLSSPLKSQCPPVGLAGEPLASQAADSLTAAASPVHSVQNCPLSWVLGTCAEPSSLAGSNFSSRVCMWAPPPREGESWWLVTARGPHSDGRAGTGVRGSVWGSTSCGRVSEGFSLHLSLLLKQVVTFRTHPLASPYPAHPPARGTWKLRKSHRHALLVHFIDEETGLAGAVASWSGHPGSSVPRASSLPCPHPGLSESFSPWPSSTPATWSVFSPRRTAVSVRPPGAHNNLLVSWPGPSRPWAGSRRLDTEMVTLRSPRLFF